MSVPDPAGWKREWMPVIPRGHRFEVVPDWICEIVSPSTESKDREIKMPLYANYSVQYAWVIDPYNRTLETFKLVNGHWTKLAHFSGDDKVAAPPFDVVTIALSDL